MNPQDAQASLDQIRAFQDRTREEMVRKIFPWSYVIISALGLFATFAAIDLGQPWDAIARGLGFALFVGVGYLYSFWISVHPRPTSPTAWPAIAGVGLGVVAIVFVAFVIGRIAGFLLFGVPAEGFLSQATVGGAAAAVVYIAIVPVVRRIIASIVLQDAGRG
ncbi:hypothetical protein AB0392_05320 [Nonomuraea angiospora]|uniref:hypothetical protein n=1 Tax=Nonomuraea angiospora TaxID=46172 RepID=UPI00344CFE94